MKSTTFRNNNFRRVALASAVMLGTFGASNSFAAPASDSAATSATVIEPITVAQAQDLAFGEFAAGAGTIVLTTGGSASPTGDVVLTGGTPAAAQFTVTGKADETFSIAVSDTDLTYNDGVTDHTMTLVPVHDLDGSTQDSPASGTLTGGTQTIYVGGTLTVAANQEPGVYAGTVTATVDYN